MKEFRVFRALGLAFKAWFRNFLPITLLACVVYAPVIVWIALSDPHMATTEDQLVNNYFLRPIVVLIGLSSLLAPLLTHRVIQELNGTRTSMLDSIRFGLRGIIPAIVVGGVAIGASYLPAGAAIVGAIVSCYWFVASPAAVVEQLGPMAALRRSSELTKGRRWGIYGLTFLINIVLIAIMLAVVMPMIQHPSGDPFAAIKRASITVAVMMAVYYTFLGIVQAVSYPLLRQDKDGVSYEELAKVFD